ncbi:uncharacterized protein LOC100185461 [Ciona intestinalis]
MTDKSDVDLLSGITEKPPDNFLDSEENNGKNEDVGAVVLEEQSRDEDQKEEILETPREAEKQEDMEGCKNDVDEGMPEEEDTSQPMEEDVGKAEIVEDPDDNEQAEVVTEETPTTKEDSEPIEMEEPVEQSTELSMEQSVETSTEPTTDLGTEPLMEHSQVYASSGVDGDLDTDTEETQPKKTHRVKEIKEKSPSPAKQTPPPTSIRRSARSNKGIGKEIFDPSHIPKSSSYKRSSTGRSERSPSSERSCSPVSSTSSVQSRKKIVHGESPRRNSPRTRDIKTKVSLELEPPTVKSPQKEKEKKPVSLQIIKKPVKKEPEFEEEDDLPLNTLKQDEDDSDEVEISDDDDDDDSDDSYNNPDRLWCICRKPHNNRFMISCDVCEDWFHGDCVGISLQRGKKMEQKQEDYICPNCIKKSKKGAKDRRKSKEEVKTEVVSTKKRSASLDEKLSLKNFALKGQIQSSSNKNPDGAPVKKKLKIFDESQIKKSNAASKKHSSSNPAMTPATTNKSDKGGRKCIVSSCGNDALKGSVYCSNQCILRHAKESLKSMAKEKELASQKSKSVKVLSKDGANITSKEHKDRVTVICRKTMKVLRGPHAPLRRDLAKFLKAHPSYEIHHKTHHTQPALTEKHLKPANHEPTNKTVASTDFYRHVEQNRKRNRYGMDPDYAPDPKKLQESQVDFFEKKSKPVITPGASTSKMHNSLSKMKERKTSTDGMRKSIDEKERKKSLDGLSKKIHDRPNPKLERTNSRGEKPAVRVERSSSKESKSSNSDIRHNVKKSILGILSKRSEESEDLRMHPSSIMRLVDKIEDSLHKLFGETNVKYKNRYRSIMFNLKDERNHGLWRKVIIGDVTTSELVQMTAEQMASKKLAEWRQNELTQELDIIEKQEKELQNFRPVSKITHKGEIEIQEDLSDLTETIHHGKNGSTAPTVAPVRKKRISLSEDENTDSSTSQSVDTTSQHNDHLFDLNCKICTGKLKEESLGPSEQHQVKTKVRHSTSIILSSEAQKVTTPSKEPTTPTSHLFTPDKVKEKSKSKVKRSDSAVKSHDSTLSPATILSSIASEKVKKKPKLPSPPPLSDVAIHVDQDAEKSAPDAKGTKQEADEEKRSTDVHVTTITAISEKTKVSDPRKSNKQIKEETPASVGVVWSGYISMLELSTFKANVYPVGGQCDELESHLPIRLVLGGRIHPKVVWEYLRKVQTLQTKQLSIIRFHAATDDDRIGYIAMLSYFSSRKRFGVVSNQDRKLVKDMYLVPLLESQPIPDELKKTGCQLSFPPNRPSMLIGIAVRHINKQPEPEHVVTAAQVKPSVKKEVEIKVQENKPVVPEPKQPLLLTEEELGSQEKKTSSGSLFERNKSLAPSLKFFMRKASEEEESIKEKPEDEEPYSPSAAIAAEEQAADDEDEDGNEAYDPEKMYEEQEEYDPETAFAPVSPAAEDAPYDPEEDEEILQKKEAESREMNELVEKQAFLERMQKELEEKKAKLAEVEHSLQQSTVSEPEAPRVDPRLARRMQPREVTTPPPATQPSPVVQPAVIPPQPPAVQHPSLPEISTSKDPLQTILSVLNMGGGASSQSSILSMLTKPKESSPPPLPDSTTKSDAEEATGITSASPEPAAAKETEKTGLVSYNSSPESQPADTEIIKTKSDEPKTKSDSKSSKSRDDDRRRRSSSASSDDSRNRRRSNHRDDRRQKRHRRSRSRSPNRHSRRHSPSRHQRRHGDHSRSWSRDRRR